MTTKKDAREEKIRKKIIVELVEVHPFYDYKKRRKFLVAYRIIDGNTK